MGFWKVRFIWQSHVPRSGDRNWMQRHVAHVAFVFPANVRFLKTMPLWSDMDILIDVGRINRSRMVVHVVGGAPKGQKLPRSQSLAPSAQRR